MKLENFSFVRYDTAKVNLLVQDARTRNSIKILPADSKTTDRSGLTFGAGSAPAILVQSWKRQ
jgi:hypothetical protein